MREPFPGPGRRRPEHGVHRDPEHSTIVFLTVCTKHRARWLACPAVQNALLDCWSGSSAWQVGDYLLMPDHLHPFCSPGDPCIELPQWVAWWKRRFSCLHIRGAGRWQRDFWDTRLRRWEHYDQKWWYIRENPVRAGLVATADEWRFQGGFHALRWRLMPRDRVRDHDGTGCRTVTHQLGARN
ncbi:MAG: hypothetical protein KF791_02700 [Verrucomicrobiae bacterium]|nr:hypothetical protein [Verrucomicrobiae bacterium]